MKFSQIQLHRGRKKLERVCAALDRYFRFGQLTTNQHRVSVALAWKMTDDPGRPMEPYEPYVWYMNTIAFHTHRTRLPLWRFLGCTSISTD